MIFIQIAVHSVTGWFKANAEPDLGDIHNSIRISPPGWFGRRKTGSGLSGRMALP
jgi:hypothetical protein